MLNDTTRKTARLVALTSELEDSDAIVATGPMDRIAPAVRLTQRADRTASQKGNASASGYLRRIAAHSAWINSRQLNLNWLTTAGANPAAAPSPIQDDQGEPP